MIQGEGAYEPYRTFQQEIMFEVLASILHLPKMPRERGRGWENNRAFSHNNVASSTNISYSLLCWGKDWWTKAKLHQWMNEKGHRNRIQYQVS